MLLYYNARNALHSLRFFKTFLCSVGAQALRGMMSVNYPLIIINTRFARFYINV